MGQTILFKDALLIDGNGGEPADGASVVVENGQIKEVDVSGKSTAPDGARVVALNGRTLMPGLIDAHVHAGNIEVNLEQTAVLPPAVYVLKTTQNLETDLSLGFTTLRDAGGLDWGFKQAIAQGLIKGPRLLLSVNMLTQSGGHGDKRGFAREQNVPRNSIGMYPEICDGPDEVRKAAREALRRGADVIKVMADGGVASPTDKLGQWQFEVDELEAAVQVARAAGTFVMAHCYADQAITNCVEAGVKTIEHGNLMGRETAELMAARGAYLVPTLTVLYVLAEYGERAGFDAIMMAKLRQVVPRALEGLEQAYKAGVKIGSGSDIIGPFQYMKGRELSIKAEIMSPMETIVSATRTNAEMLNLGDRLGTVEPGKLADLIVVDGNPLQDLGLFEHDREGVVLVMKEGDIYKETL
jgi:imidazolonepropionase-like amidohydrolase